LRYQRKEIDYLLDALIEQLRRWVSEGILSPLLMALSLGWLLPLIVEKLVELGDDI